LAFQKQLCCAYFQFAWVHMPKPGKQSVTCNSEYLSDLRMVCRAKEDKKANSGDAAV